MAGRGIYAQHRNESEVSFCPAAEVLREQVERVVSDPLFCNSKRYSNLLRFIAERSLDGRNGDLKERIIGIEVFGRNPGYDTSLDATVRVAAAEVRKRLALYYRQTGRTNRNFGLIYLTAPIWQSSGCPSRPSQIRNRNWSRRGESYFGL